MISLVDPHRRRTFPRVPAFAAGRLAWAGLQLMLAMSRAVPPTKTVAALSIRNLLQGAATALKPTSEVLRLGAAVDVVHAGSMLGFALARRHRALAVADAVVAAGAGAAGIRLASKLDAPAARPTTSQRRAHAE